MVQLLKYMREGNQRKRYIIASQKQNKNQTGDIFQIAYYWKSREKVVKDYNVFVHITTQEGKIALQQDPELAYGEYPTSNWKLGDL